MVTLTNLTNGKELIGSSFLFGEFINYLNIDQLFEIIYEIDQFNILVGWKAYKKSLSYTFYYYT